MKTFCLNTMIAVSLLFCFNGLQAQTSQKQPNAVAFGTIDTIHSKILNERRRLLVYVPASASSEIYTKQIYPVVYLLDGDAVHFSSVVSMIRQLNSSYACPEMIVVGILNTDRMRDFTPTPMNSYRFLNFVDSITLKNSGGVKILFHFSKKN